MARDDANEPNPPRELPGTANPPATPAGADVTPGKRPALGDRVELRIDDLAFGGEGVGRINELVVFVPFVVPGERVEVKITELKKSFARGVLCRILQTAPGRVEPRCEYFGECGGCQYQHIAYEDQVRWKHKQVSDLFQRVGDFDPAVVDPVVPCPQPYGYRNRILVRSQWNKPAQRLNLGFIRQDCGLVIDVESCAIAEPSLNDAIQHWRAHPPPKGGIKTVLRIPPEGWEVPEHSFFQNNFFLLPKLVSTVADRLRESGVQHLIDAYCGVGFFGIELAGCVDSFVGIELDAPAVKAARRNAASRGIRNGEFIAADTDAALPGQLARLDPERTAVVLDPPRVGCRPASLDVLRSNRPRQILYVSCHPATLARDLKLLCADGVYELRRVTPLDMFPQTQHVECVADLRRV